MNNRKFEILKGMTLISIENLDDEQIVFKTKCNRKFQLFHYQDCYESVIVEDISGNLSDLLDNPILLAEEIIETGTEDGDEFVTWTFYKLSTIKGSVTIRWYGESNGYYSESVDFIEIGCEEQWTKVNGYL